MAIAEDIIGTHYRYPDHFEVGREKIREFARAVKDEHPAHYTEDAAGTWLRRAGRMLTFLAVAAPRCSWNLRTVRCADQHGARLAPRPEDQVHRPILAGDKLFFDSYLDSVIEAHGTVVTEIAAR